MSYNKYLHLVGDINYDSVDSVLSFLRRQGKEKIVYIASNGGDEEAMLGIMDLFKHTNKNITTITVGMAASAAAEIFVAGHTRLMLPRSFLLFHHTTADPGKSKTKDLEITSKYYNNTQILAVDNIHNQTGLDHAFIKRKLYKPHDVILSAKEAVDLKLAHRVITRLP